MKRKLPTVTSITLTYLTIWQPSMKNQITTKRPSKILDKALLAARKKYDNRDIEYGKELDKIANLQINIGEYDKATDNLDEAIDIMSESKVEESGAYLAGACDHRG